MDKMSIDKKILEEIKRVNYITNYITEQGAPEDPLADLGGAPAPGGPEGGAPAPGAPEGGAPAPGASEGGSPEPIDISKDPDVEEVGKEEDEEGEELDITDLVTAQKNIEDKQEEYFQNLFKQLEAMDTKLKEMDGLTNRLSSIEDKIEKYKPKTPQEKLELRSLDSGPFKQNLADFFNEKKDEMEQTGKNEYVLTQDEVENFSPSEIKKTFNQPME